ncbi:MAG: SDR family oxidoreductase [Acidobacteria bacterium]|nr:SDR family oxidoreductase [Acidobacteriota bacterium]
MSDQQTSVLVTGVASGIGKACAERFLTEGWRVLGWDLIDPELDGIVFEKVDVSDWAAGLKAGRRLPALKAVVNSAGIASRLPATELDHEEWDRLVAVNLTGSFYVARFTFDALSRGTGALIFLGSVAGTAGFANRSAYCASKAGVLALTRCLAIEWATYGIRVMSVSPTFTRTGLVLDGIQSGRTNESDIIDHTPQRRLLEADEVAGVIYQVVQPSFGAVTGSDVLVDAGFNALSGF